MNTQSFVNAKLAPVPCGLSTENNGTRLLYRCAACDHDLGIANDRPGTCPHCHASLNWSNLPKCCSEEFRNGYNKVKNNHQMPVGRRLNTLASMLYALYCAATAE